MLLMAGLGVMLLVGVILTILWSRCRYVEWHPSAAQHSPERTGGEAASTVGGSATMTPAMAARRYLRGVAVALVGGVWAGALVTGPAMRLIMRLLAVTAGDEAQGAITEAEQVVGRITLEETFGLYMFGGVLPGIVSGVLYVLVRRLLPRGWLGGLTFGLLHLVFLATRIDPLRPGNEDFDIVGPGWLAVLTFGLAVVGHGMAVAALANRYSTAFPTPGGASRRQRVVALLPLVGPALVLVPGAFLLVPIGLGLLVAVAAGTGRSTGPTRWHPKVVTGLRAMVVVAALAATPATVGDLAEIVNRPEDRRSAAGD